MYNKMTEITKFVSTTIISYKQYMYYNTTLTPYKQGKKKIPILIIVTIRTWYQNIDNDNYTSLNHD